jgi:hypothetical protein
MKIKQGYNKPFEKLNEVRVMLDATLENIPNILELVKESISYAFFPVFKNTEQPYKTEPAK